MSESRQATILRLADEIDSVTVNVNSYYEDSSYKELTDSALAGKLRALRQYADAEGWLPLVLQIDGLCLDYPDANVIANLEAVRNFAIPEARRLAQRLSDDEARIRASGLWDMIHPRVRKVSRSRFETGHYADAVESAFKELNTTVKDLVLKETGEEVDGAKLMNRAFTPNGPLVRLADLATESGRSIQDGYHKIFVGAMTGIRNPNAHAVIDMERPRAVHLIYLASLLFTMFDERS